jgi:hypothetical protein
MMMPKQNEAGRRKAKYQRQELLLKLWRWNVICFI